MARYKCSEEIHNRCENSALCHLCDGEALYKNTTEEKKKKREQREANKEAERSALVKSHRKEKKEGMGFEKRVAKKWNDKFGSRKKKQVAKPRIDVESIVAGEEPEEVVEERSFPRPLPADKGAILPPPMKKKSRDEAQRQFNSGAFWHSKGDIKLEHALLECKERGTTNSRGEKQITVPKSWLEKQEKEAFQEQRPYWYVPFGYKGDDSVYLIKPYDHEIEMIYEMRQAREEIEKLNEKIRELEEKINENG